MRLNLFSLATLLPTVFISSVSSKVFFKEDFTSDDSLKAWVKSEAKENIGAIELSSGDWYADKENSRGLKLAQDAHFYDYSAPLITPMSLKDNDLVLQFVVKYQQDIDCGGAYIKLLPPTADPKKFNGDSEYSIMFGPDVCGADSKIHAIINYNNTNNEMIKKPLARKDQLSHQYTLWIKKDKTYEIRVDNSILRNGTLADDWSMLPPKEIHDPKEVKPADWDDRKTIPDEKDVKPENYDDIPKKIVDPAASKPAEWDDDMDGDWEAPLIDNPEYKGEWKQKEIENPDYKGVWTAKLIPNPDYSEEGLLEQEIGFIGIDIWTVKSGTIFDNIILTNDFEEASEFGNKTWAAFVQTEIDVKDKLDKEEQEKREKEAAKAKAEAEAEAERKKGEDDKDAKVDDKDLELEDDLKPESNVESEKKEESAEKEESSEEEKSAEKEESSEEQSEEKEESSEEEESSESTEEEVSSDKEESSSASDGKDEL
ncbi:Calreticulin [Smittium mucronatum]|uniref:Calreticulin n=1 Tax=Smittium mucronatum TaxID=133383 RepID=A0A1R0H731_9FUNG|nr:Calreticulin [Smittium mucronatum]